jgi:hypothetical protein
MLNLAYTISPFLIRYRDKLEVARRNILLYPLSPKRELSLQHNATIARLQFAFLLEEESVSKDEIKKVLGNQISFVTQTRLQASRVGDRHQKSLDMRLFRYKQAHDYLRQEWLVSEETVTVDTLIKLHDLVSPGRLQVHEKQLQEVLDYLQTATDNPFIQAAIAKLVFNALQAFTEGNERFSTLCSYLFLYKAGLDYRGLLILEEPWAKNISSYRGQYRTALKKTNITGWLEYFIKYAYTQVEQVYQEGIKEMGASRPSEHNKDKAGDLSERQKAILALLDDPNAVITNRTVQSIFKISQITASRDLAKLAKFGLLFVHGKGRSVRYTRV